MAKNEKAPDAVVAHRQEQAIERRAALRRIASVRVSSFWTGVPYRLAEASRYQGPAYDSGRVGDRALPQSGETEDFAQLSYYSYYSSGYASYTTTYPSYYTSYYSSYSNY